MEPVSAPHTMKNPLQRPADARQHLQKRKAPTPRMDHTSGRGKHQRLGWTTPTVICIILLMSPADQCNATTSNNDRLPTIAEPQLTTSSRNQFTSPLAAIQTHFNTTKICGIRPHSASSELPLMAVALSPCAMADAFYSYYKSE
ncbi:unnamed protein product [Boreogadus saida]